MAASGFDIGRLLRLKGSIDASASAVEPGPHAAPALTESYMRLRGQVRELIDGSDLLKEFDAQFPEIEIAEMPAREHPRNIVKRTNAWEAESRRAASLIGELAGWIDGMIAEQTLSERIKAEAAERVKQEQRRPPGFQAEE